VIKSIDQAMVKQVDKFQQSAQIDRAIGEAMVKQLDEFQQSVQKENPQPVKLESQVPIDSKIQQKEVSQPLEQQLEGEPEDDGNLDKSEEELREKIEELQTGIKDEVKQSVSRAQKLNAIAPDSKVNESIKDGIDKHSRLAKKSGYTEPLREEKLDELCQKFIESNREAIDQAVEKQLKDKYVDYPVEPSNDGFLEAEKKRQEIREELEKQLKDGFRKALDPLTVKIIEMRSHVEKLEEINELKPISASEDPEVESEPEPTLESKLESKSEPVPEPAPVLNPDSKKQEDKEEPKPKTDDKAKESFSFEEEYKNIKPNCSISTPYRAALGLGCTMDGLKDKSIGIIEQANKVFTAQHDLLKTANDDQKAAFLKLQDAIEGSLTYIDGIDLTSPEASQRSALRTLAANLDVGIKGKKDEDLKKELVDKAMKTGMDQKQAEAYVAQMQEIIQLRLALGAKDAIKLEKFQGELDSYIEKLKKQDEQFRAIAKKGVTPPGSTKGYRLHWLLDRESANAERKKHLDENAVDMGNGLYAQVGPDGNTHYSMTKIDQDNLDTIAKSVNGPGVLWTNIPSQHRDKAEMAALKEWKTARFKGGGLFGRGDGLTDLSKCLPLRKGDWTGLLKNISEQHGTGVSSKSHALYQKVLKDMVGNDPKRLKEFWDDVIKNGDQALINRVKIHLSEEQKKILGVTQAQAQQQLAEKTKDYQSQIELNELSKQPAVEHYTKTQNELKDLEKQHKEQVGEFETLKAELAKPNLGEQVKKELATKLQAKEGELKQLKENIVDKRDMLALLVDPQKLEKEIKSRQEELKKQQELALEEQKTLEATKQKLELAKPELEPDKQKQERDKLELDKLELDKKANDKKLEGLKLDIVEQQRRLDKLNEQKLVEQKKNEDVKRTESEQQKKLPEQLKRLEELKKQGMSPKPEGAMLLEKEKLEREEKALKKGDDRLKPLVNPPEPKSDPKNLTEMKEKEKVVKQEQEKKELQEQEKKQQQVQEVKPKPEEPRLGVNPVPMQPKPEPKPEESIKDKASRLTDQLKEIISGSQTLTGAIKKIEANKELHGDILSKLPPKGSSATNLLREVSDGLDKITEESDARERLDKEALKSLNSTLKTIGINTGNINPVNLLGAITGAQESIKETDELKESKERKKGLEQDMKKDDEELKGEPNAPKPKQGP
jgi:hypothetical protein